MANTFKYNQDNLLGGLSNTPELNKPYSEVKDCENVMFNLKRGVERRNQLIPTDFFDLKSAESKGTLEDALRVPFLYNKDYDYYKEFDYNGRKLVLIIIDARKRERINVAPEIVQESVGGVGSGEEFNNNMLLSDFAFVAYNNYEYKYSPLTGLLGQPITPSGFYPVIYDKETGDILFSISDIHNMQKRSSVDGQFLEQADTERYHVKYENFDIESLQQLIDIQSMEARSNLRNNSDEEENVYAKDIFRSEIDFKGNIILVNKYNRVEVDNIFGLVSLDSYSGAKNYLENNPNKNDEKLEKIADKTEEIIEVLTVDFDTYYEFFYSLHVISEDLSTVYSDRNAVGFATPSADYVDGETEASDIVNIKYFTKKIYDDILENINSYSSNPSLVFECIDISYDDDLGIIRFRKTKEFIKRFMKLLKTEQIIRNNKFIEKKEKISNIYKNNIDKINYQFLQDLYSSNNSFSLDQFYILSNVLSITMNNNLVKVGRETIDKGYSGGYREAFGSRDSGFSLAEFVSYSEFENTFRVIKPSYFADYNKYINDFDENDWPNDAQRLHGTNRIDGQIRDISIINTDILPDGYIVRVNPNIGSEVDNVDSTMFYIKENGKMKECPFISSIIFFNEIDVDNFEFDYIDITSGSYKTNIMVFSNEDNNLIDSLYSTRNTNYYFRPILHSPNKSGKVLFNKDYPDFLEYNKNRDYFNGEGINFKGRRISDIKLIESRLMLLYDNDVYFSQSKEYSGFYPQSLFQQMPDDPIHITYLNSSGARFEYAVNYRNNLVIFTNNDYQVMMNYEGRLALENVNFSDFGNFKVNLDIGVKNYNNRLYFISTNKNGESLLYNLYENNNGILKVRTLNNKIIGKDFKYNDFYIYENMVVIQSAENKAEFLLNEAGYNYEGEKEVDVWTKLNFDYEPYFTIFDEDYMYINYKNGNTYKFYLKNYRDNDPEKPLLMVDRVIENTDIDYITALKGLTLDQFDSDWSPEENKLIEYSEDRIFVFLSGYYNPAKKIFLNNNTIELVSNDKIFVILDGVECEVINIKSELTNAGQLEHFDRVILEVRVSDPDIIEYGKIALGYEDSYSQAVNFGRLDNSKKGSLGVKYDSYIELNEFYITDRYSGQKITYGKTNIIECGFLFSEANSFNVRVNTKRGNEKLYKYNYKPKLSNILEDPVYSQYDKVDNSLFNAKIKSSNKDYSIRLENNSASNFIIKSLIYKVNFENKK